MATAHLFGPYYVLEMPETAFRPGEVRVFGFGPWPSFRDGTVTVSAGIQDFGPFQTGTVRGITVEPVEYSMRSTTESYIHFAYRNSGNEPIRGYYFMLGVVLP